MKLIDTSALLDLMIAKDSDKLNNSFILDLTAYELINAVWKQSTKTKAISRKEAEQVIGDFGKLNLNMIRVNTEDMPGIFAIAHEFNLTAYDAAYLYCSNKYGLELVTKDKRMHEAEERLERK